LSEKNGSTVMNDVLAHVIDNWTFLDNKLVIHGRVIEMAVRPSIRRSGLAGSSYDSDEFPLYAKLELDDLKCDIVIEHPEAEIVASGGDLAIVGAVARQFARTIELAAFEVMLQHEETVYNARDLAQSPKFQKEVTTTDRVVTASTI